MNDFLAGCLFVGFLAGCLLQALLMNDFLIGCLFVGFLAGCFLQALLMKGFLGGCLLQVSSLVVYYRFPHWLFITGSFDERFCRLLFIAGIFAGYPATFDAPIAG